MDRNKLLASLLQGILVAWFRGGPYLLLLGVGYLLYSFLSGDDPTAAVRDIGKGLIGFIFVAGMLALVFGVGAWLVDRFKVARYIWIALLTCLAAFALFRCGTEFGECVPTRYIECY